MLFFSSSSHYFFLLAKKPIGQLLIQTRKLFSVTSVVLMVTLFLFTVWLQIHPTLLKLGRLQYTTIRLNKHCVVVFVDK